MFQRHPKYPSRHDARERPRRRETISAIHKLVARQMRFIPLVQVSFSFLQLKILVILAVLHQPHSIKLNLDHLTNY